MKKGSSSSYEVIEAVGEWRIVRHPGNGVLYADWYDPGARQVRRASLKTKKLGDALRKLDNLKERGIRGDPRAHLVDALPPTLGQLLDKHRTYVAKLASAEAEQIAIRRLIESTLADRIADSLTIEDWEELRDCWLAEGSTVSTVSRRLSTARSALRRSFNARLISRPVHVPEFRSSSAMYDAEPKGAVLTTDELAAWYDGYTEPHLQLWMALMLGTAARRSAILELEGEQIDVATGRIRLNPRHRSQTKKFRPVLPIHDHLGPWIKHLPRGRLILWRGKPVLNVKKGMHKALDRAALHNKNVNSYSIRHTMGRYLADQGVDIKEIAYWLGHDHEPARRITRIYSPTSPDYLQNARAVVAQFVAEIASKAKTPLLEPPLAVELMLQRLIEEEAAGDDRDNG